MKTLKQHLLDHTVKVDYPSYCKNPTIIDIMKCNSINETEVTDADLQRLSKLLWSDVVHRNYDDWHENHVYETLNKSFDAEELIDKIHKKFEKHLVYLGDTNPHIDSKEKSFTLYAKDETLKQDEDFKSLLNFYNYYISFYEKRKDYWEIYIEPYNPEEKTDYIYNECKGIVYRYVNDNGLKRLNRHGLVPRHDNDRYYPRYIFVVADNDKEKLKDAISKIQNEIKKKNLHLIKIDLNAYHNKIRFFTDPASVNYPAYLTREYIPRYCCTEIELNEL